MCNGHAYICPPTSDNTILQCECQHKTTGLNCDQCMDGFTQKKWRRYTAADQFECEPCNCNGHSNKCHFDQEVADQQLSMDIHGNYEGGGVCEECQQFTTGTNCHECQDGYFREPGVLANATVPCVPCDCPDPRHTGNCRPADGLCECGEPWRGAEDCSACAQGYYDYPDCKPCACFPAGTQEDEAGAPVCTSGGQDLQCPCKENFGGAFCDECAPGFYNFPECTREYQQAAGCRVVGLLSCQGDISTCAAQRASVARTTARARCATRRTGSAAAWLSTAAGPARSAATATTTTPSAYVSIPAQCHTSAAFPHTRSH